MFAFAFAFIGIPIDQTMLPCDAGCSAETLSASCTGTLSANGSGVLLEQAIPSAYVRTDVLMCIKAQTKLLTFPQNK